jgi:hypothetical protein
MNSIIYFQGLPLKLQGPLEKMIRPPSVFEAGELIMEPMRNVILDHVPKARMIRLDGPPVVGPLMLGMRAAGIDPYPMRGKLIETAKRLVS